MNAIGVAAALATFFGVWLGHVAVRKIESVSPVLWIPSAGFVVLGLVTEFASLSATSRPLSTVFGILGVTLLFDAFELFRQQKRVIKGHAPANPGNPRHIRILAQYPQATTLDPLKRDPASKPLAAGQAPPNL